MTNRRFHIDKELVLLFLLSAFALVPLLSPGYFFDAHDADHSVFFLVEFDAALKDGALWPIWGPDHALGYGYPLWLIYAPLAYFVAEGFHFLGLGFTAAVKATWILAFIFGAWGMYLLLRRWWGRSPAGRTAALIGALAYSYAPYHFLNLYVRAAFAEFCALAWFPWVLLAFDRLVDPGVRSSSAARRSGWLIAVAALSLAGLLLTHSGSILIFTPLLAAYLAFAVLRRAYRSGTRPLVSAVQDASDPQHTLTALGLRSPLYLSWQEFWQTCVRVLVAGLLAGGLAAIFLLPLLLEQRYIVQDQWVQGTYGYRQHFVYLSQYLDPFWGFGYSDDPLGPGDGMSFQLGIVTVVLATVAGVIGLRRPALQRSTTAFFALATLAVLVLMLPAAQPIWDAVGLLALIQFPWRLLGLAALSLSVLASAAVVNLLGIAEPEQPAQGKQVPAGLILALVVVLASLPFTMPEYTDITPVEESPLSIIRFETEHPDMVGITSFAEQVPTDSPLLEQYRSGEPLQKAAILAGSGQVETVRVGGASVTARVSAEESVTVLFYTYDFPGWRAAVDGERVVHRAEPPYGLIAVDLPAGQHTVDIRHGTTPARTVGALISLLSLALAVLLIWRGAGPGSSGERVES